MTDVVAQPRPEPKRDRWGRYLIGGKPYTRVTTFAASIDDRFNLEQWKVRMCAAGLVARQDLFAQAAANIDNKQKLNKLCDEAIEAAKGSAGANLGSALHSFTEQVDLGLTPTVPAPWDADIAAYTATLEANGVTISPQYVERIVVHHGLGVAGTFDRLVTVDGWPLPVIADLKTGNLEHASAFGAIAVQLACYAMAQDLYDPASDLLEPMPPVDPNRALVIHLPAGKATCTLHVVDIAAGWRAAQLCRQVRDWRKQKDLASPFTVGSLGPGVAERVAWLAERIINLRDEHPKAFGDLLAAWPANCPTFKQGGHTVEHVELIALTLSTIEARHAVAFGDSDPADSRVDAAVVVSLVARLKALPDDLLAAVKSAAKTLGVPNVESHRFTVAHLAEVEPLIADAEQASVQRTSTDVQENRSTAA